MASTFTVYSPETPNKQAPAAEELVFLRDGFSFAAFFFGPLWLAWRRAWIPALAFAAALIVVNGVGGAVGLSEVALSIITFAMNLALGFEGAQLVSWSLARRGFREKALVVGADLDEAEELYFRDRLTVRPAVPPPAPLPPQLLAQERQG